MSGVLSKDGLLKLRIRSSIEQVLQSIQQAASKCGRQPPRLVTVSKTQPVKKIGWAYSHGLRHFGENYVKELHNKATILQACGSVYGDIRWHFIGNIQSNQVKKLLETPNLWMVETICHQTTAQALNNRWGLSSNSSYLEPLKVLIQVNTSRKEDKQGCMPECVADLAGYILEDCPYLRLCGLMCAGLNPKLPSNLNTPAQPPAQPPAAREAFPSIHEFPKLVQCRAELLEGGVAAESLVELSMGMTADFHAAIEAGSTNVRIGSAVFGAREKVAAPQ